MYMRLAFQTPLFHKKNCTRLSWENNKHKGLERPGACSVCELRVSALLQ